MWSEEPGTDLDHQCVLQVRPDSGFRRFTASGDAERDGLTEQAGINWAEPLSLVPHPYCRSGQFPVGCVL